MKRTAATQVSISISLTITVAGLFSIFILNEKLKTHAQKEATQQARILLDRNLAPHTYFSHQLKPSLEGETVSAISIRIPLDAAYKDINILIWQSSGLFAMTLLIVNGLSIYLSKRWTFCPLSKIRIKSMEVAKNPKYLGEQIEAPASQELADLTEAFNLMSVNLRQERDKLELRVRERTAELHDVNSQLEIEISEHKNTITKLENSLKKVKKLNGLLPICAHCKKIRDDKGYWNQIESYIHEHSEAEFSHGICQECAKKYYPDLNIYKE